MPTVNCHLLVWAIKLTEDVYVEVHLPAVPNPSVSNNVVISLPVGDGGSTSWPICGVEYAASPDPDCSSIELFTKPVQLPKEKAIALVNEIKQKFRVLLSDEEILEDQAHDNQSIETVSEET